MPSVAGADVVASSLVATVGVSRSVVYRALSRAASGHDVIVHADTTVCGAFVIGVRAEAHVVTVPSGFQVEVWRPTASHPFRLLRLAQLDHACARAVVEALPWRGT